MAKYVDLHVHSTASDGTCSPAEDVRLAAEAGLAAFALTDHDTTKGYREAAEELARLKEENPELELELIPGVEISAGFNERDIHILGLFIDPDNEELVRELREAEESRIKRTEKMIQRFKDIGIEITHEELTQGAEKTVVTRAHFSRVLLAKGIVKTNAEAFEKYLDYDGPCYVPRGYIEPERAIELITNAGGIPVFAHPFNYKIDRKVILELLEKRLVPAGIKGLEVLHSTNKPEDDDILKAVAVQNGLMMTGGSDFHGKNKPGIFIGKGKGNMRIPYAYYETLRRYKNEHES